MPQFTLLWNKWPAYIYSGDHNPPHFHVHRHETDITVEIATVKIKGNVSGKERREVMDWVKRNQDALLKNWDLAQEGELPEHIPW